MPRKMRNFTNKRYITRSIRHDILQYDVTLHLGLYYNRCIGSNPISFIPLASLAAVADTLAVADVVLGLLAAPAPARNLRSNTFWMTNLIRYWYLLWQLSKWISQSIFHPRQLIFLFLALRFYGVSQLIVGQPITDTWLFQNETITLFRSSSLCIARHLAFFKFIA